MMAANPQLRLVALTATGVDNVDVAAASERGIYVANCPGKNSIAVAELAFALILALDRRIADNVISLRALRRALAMYQEGALEGRDVLVVEDIIDTGLTLNYLVRYLRGKNPSSLRICTLLDKPARRLVEIPIDYRGFEIPDRFVIGYGLDYGERYRNLRFVGVLRPEVYAGPE